MNIELGDRESVSDFYFSDSDQKYVLGSPLLSNPQIHPTKWTTSPVQNDESHDLDTATNT